MYERLAKKIRFTNYKDGEEVIAVRGKVNNPFDDGIWYDDRDDGFYHIGPAIDRLYEYEELGYTPAELRELISLSKPKPLTIDQIYSLGQSTSLYKDIHAIIDDGMKKRDRAVSIFFGSQGISIDITPFPEVEEIKEERDERR